MLEYTAKYPHAKNGENPPSSFEKNVWQADRQTNRQMEGQTGLILKDPFPKDGGLMFFRNLKIKFS